MLVLVYGLDILVTFSCAHNFSFCLERQHLIFENIEWCIQILTPTFYFVCVCMCVVCRCVKVFLVSISAFYLCACEQNLPFGKYPFCLPTQRHIYVAQCVLWDKG